MIEVAIPGGDSLRLANALLQADIVCPSICDALDLLLTPGRIVATLRG
jgi:hypothetical protein